jgi:asparagine synthase (glutamine-hydrolysing)
MCGIAGFNWEDPDLGRRMNVLQAHRGPDGEGLRVADGVTLAHRRLAIIDLSDAGRQPMPNEDGSVWLVYNGEIYNAPDLRQELEALGHRFRSRTDSEVILHGYEAWGPACVERFNGQFAFCVHDVKGRRLFLARDRFGIKPLHFWHAGRRFAFASEIKALLACPDIPRRANDLAVYDYLAYNCYNHTDATFFEDVRALRPGHRATFDLDSGRLAVERFYEIPLRDPADPGLAAACDEFRRLFYDAIFLRLVRADVEVGSCLSGGLDSSSIVCGLHARAPDRSRGHKTFSLTFPDKPEVNESHYVDEVVARTGVDAKRTTSHTEKLLEDLQRLIYHQDEPFGGPSIYGQWEVMRLAGEHHIKVLLDGQGGDELLAGYFFFYGYHFLELAGRGRLMELARELGGYRRRHRGVWDGLLAPLLFLAPRFLKRRLTRRYLRVPIRTDFARRWASASTVPEEMYRRMPLNRALKMRFEVSLPQLLREEDRNSMAYSIESRLPFLDHRLVEFAMNLPGGYKIHRGQTKYVLREALRGVLPEDIRTRAGKLGFGTPINDWLRTPEMSALVREVFASPEFRGRPYLDPERILALFEDHQAGRTDSYQTIWKALNLELWLRRFVDAADVTPP